MDKCEAERAQDGGVSKRNLEKTRGVENQMDGVAVTSGETGCWLRVCVEQPHDAERVERVSERDWGGGGREKEGKVAKGDDCGGGPA